jgi:hypothetical protein
VGGFECVGHCEIDRYANQAYNAMYDTEGECFFEDARTTDPGTLPDIDLICGGFPCQSFSIAGKRRGFADDARGTLFFDDCKSLFATNSALPPLKDLHFCCLRMFPDSKVAQQLFRSDILETDVPERYFLSQIQMERLLCKSYQARRDGGSTPPQECLSP